MPGAVASAAPSPAETRLGDDDVLRLPRADVAALALPVGVTPGSRSPLRDLLRLPELTTPRVGASTVPAADRVGEPDHDARDWRRDNRLQLRRTATGVTVYVNGDPVNLVDPDGHNPCSYEGTGPDGCPHDVNWAQAAQSRPGSGTNSGSGGGSAAPRTYAQSRSWSQAVGGYYRSFRLLGIFGGGQACDADCALQRAEQQVLDHWSQGGDFGDFLGGFKDLAGDTAGGLGVLGKGAWSCTQTGHLSECGHFSLGVGMQGAMLTTPVGQAAIAQGVLQQAKCTTGNIAHCAGYAIAAVGTAVATEGAARATVLPRAAEVDLGAAPTIKVGSAGGTTAGRPFPQSVKDLAQADDPTSTCVYCGSPGAGTQVDHSIPRSRNGDATIGNAQLACPWCNASKGARDFPVNPPPGYEGGWPPYWWEILNDL